MVSTSILWAAAQIRAFGQVLATAADIPVNPAIATAAAVIIVYTASGGLLAYLAFARVQGQAT